MLVYFRNDHINTNKNILIALPDGSLFDGAVKR